ncbi:hypothetical protein BDA96_02G014900 [Sorghum bicolor]|uniref:CCHC-type domain-containing protein n=1 Tax=Sorghum bicolor TaxID=4558 RepID=A0A921RL39_SORBI|nr:hypothetical protein BDA96_02G014900 [Sorghum bicolor]
MEPLPPPPPSSPPPHDAPTATGARSAAVGHQPDPSPTTNCDSAKRPTHHPEIQPDSTVRRAARVKSVVVGSIQIALDSTPADIARRAARKVRFATIPPCSSNHHSRVRHYSPPPSFVLSNGRSTARFGAAEPSAASQGEDRTNRQRSEPDAEGWTEVRYRHNRRRGNQAHSRRSPTGNTAPRSAIHQIVKGKCLRCLSRGHTAAACRDPVRCLTCGRIGHKARDCKPPSKQPRLQAAPKQPPHPEDIAAFPELPSPAMALPGAPQLRPMETAATAATNTAMEEELQRLSRCAMVACLCRERDDVSPEEVKRMLCTKLGVLDRDIKVTRHRPEDFLIVFEHQHHRDAALDMRRPQVGSIGIRFLPWRILPYSDRIELRHHVRLCLEGIPAHAWNESIAKRTIARACDIDYMEGRSIRRDDTRALCLWAWTHDPSDIPKVTWLTLTGGSAVVHEGAAPPRGRCGLTFRVLVHLDIVEPPPAEYGNSIARTIDWRYGVVDGERIPRERRDPPPDASRDRRRDDDDDDRRGRRSDKNRGWGSRMFRSLSRAPNRDRERERSASRQGRRHDAASSSGGRRRTSSQGSPSGLNKACREVQTPAPAPEPQRGRSVERSSPRRGGHVQRSPPRDVARQQDHGSPPRALDSPRLRDTRCSNFNDRDRSPSPSPQALRVQAARATSPADSIVHCRAHHQDEREETLRPSFARFKPGRVFTRRHRNDKASATPPTTEDAAITAPYTAPRLLPVSSRDAITPAGRAGLVASGHIVAAPHRPPPRLTRPREAHGRRLSSPPLQGRCPPPYFVFQPTGGTRVVAARHRQPIVESVAAPALRQGHGRGATLWTVPDRSS